MNEHNLSIKSSSLHELFGPANAHIDYFNKKFPLLRIVVRGGAIKLTGAQEQILRYETRLSDLEAYVVRYGHISPRVIDQICDASALEGKKSAPSVVEAQAAADPALENLILWGNNGTPIRAQTKNQKLLVDAYTKNDMLFAVGPAGSGKTYTAIALAVRALKSKEVKRIILTRPAVEAGEKLGFLPGDMKEKLDPYLQPLYDALGDMMPRARLNEYMAEGVVQIAPLAYMRGRTLDSAVVILDEAQNTTKEQLKMFWTRMGRSAKFLITGDLTQVDLPPAQQSGLVYAIEHLRGIKGISIIEMNTKDILRHPLVGRIVKAYGDDQ